MASMLETASFPARGQGTATLASDLARPDCPERSGHGPAAPARSGLSGRPAQADRPHECRRQLAGFSVTVDQLLQNRVFWVPSLDLYLSVGEPPVSFEQHQRSCAKWKGRRILDEVHRQPEATYDDFTARWEDMGSPSYEHPRQTPPGHVVCLTWDSAIPKFGIDRGAGVWSDLGTPGHVPIRVRLRRAGPGSEANLERADARWTACP